MPENYARFEYAKYYCRECDSYTIVDSWGQAYADDGIIRCDCSDFEEEE